MKTTVASATACLAGLAIFALATPASAAPTGIQDWSQTPAKVTAVQNVIQPTYTAGLPLHSTTDIEIEKCGGGYVISAEYDRNTAIKQGPTLTIKQVGSASDCDTDPATWFGKVSTVSTPAGKAIISAQCGWDAAAQAPMGGYNGGPCKRSDVARTGGLILIAPSGKNPAVQVETTGLSYAQLLKVAKGLKPVA